MRVLVVLRDVLLTKILIQVPRPQGWEHAEKGRGGRQRRIRPAAALSAAAATATGALRLEKEGERWGGRDRSVYFF